MATKGDPRVGVVKDHERTRSTSLDHGEQKLNLSSPPAQNSLLVPPTAGERVPVRRCSHQVERPKNTLIHVARPEESLTAVAVMYNTTPSEMRRLNRLMSDMIHPGQILWVPGENYVSAGYSSASSFPGPSLKNIIENASKTEEKKKDKKTIKKGRRASEANLPQSTEVFKIEAPYLTGDKSEDALWGVLTISPKEVRFAPRDPEDETQSVVWELVRYRMSLGQTLRSVKISDSVPISINQLSASMTSLDQMTSVPEDAESLDVTPTTDAEMSSADPTHAQPGSGTEIPQTSINKEQDMLKGFGPVKYLRVKLGQQASPTVTRLIERTFQNLMIPVGVETSTVESWARHCFAVPLDRVNELTAYLTRWYPQQMSKSAPAHTEKLVRQTSFDRRILRRNLSVLEVCRLPLPAMSDHSALLTHIQIRILCEHLPVVADGRPWKEVYSTDKHGFSISTLYRNAASMESCTLLLVQDTENKVFGAMLPCSIKCSEGYYGSGESFLFTFYPIFKKYRWGGKNDFFVSGMPDSLSIGSGDGVIGLWMDGDLHRGRTQKCETYDNEPLTESGDFYIKSIEVWGFPFTL